MLDSTEPAKKLRWILLGTFGGMLLLMTVAGYDSLRSLGELDRLSREASERFSAHSQALTAVVVSFDGYNDRMEKYLLVDLLVQNQPDTKEIADRGLAVHSALRAYPGDARAEEQSLLHQIDEILTAEERVFSLAPTWRNVERKRQGLLLVEQELVPRRTQVLALLSAVSRLNNTRRIAEKEALAAEFLDLQTRLTRMVALALLAGMVLAAAAGYYILRLEQSGRKRYLALARSREELAGLSRRLVEVQEAERLAISRELHDEVGQTLGALLVDLGQLTNLVPAADTVVRDQIVRIKTTAETAVRSIRDMALLLRPPMLDDLGLVPALDWQARETSRRGEMEVEVLAGELPSDLPNDVKVGIYRLVQEALQNAAQHAHAKTARVTLRHAGHKVEVEISDDGVGFQPERTRGMGILGMEERVRQLGGVFGLRSAPGRGTTVRAELPLEEKEPA